MASRECDVTIGPCGCGAWHDAPVEATNVILEGKKRVENTTFLDGAVAMASVRKQDPLAAYVLELVRRVIALEHQMKKKRPRGEVSRDEFEELSNEVRRVARLANNLETC